MNFGYAILSVILVSLVSILSTIPLFIQKKISDKTLLFLLSISVGVLLSTVFIHFLPEIVSQEYNLKIALYILLGFLLMFILEKFIHYHHNKKCESSDCGHSHAYHLAPVNLIGDGIHNFIDGLVIAGSYAVNVVVGVTATLSIIFHEIPQELADFGILLYSGFSKKKALMFNFLSALTSILGVIVGFLLLTKLSGFIYFVIPFAAGNFIYIAASNLLPQLHRRCNLKDTFVHFFAIVLGIFIVVLISIFLPGH